MNRARLEWLEAMAQAGREAWDETSSNHDAKPSPQKYAAPWASLSKIGELLMKEPSMDKPTQTTLDEATQRVVSEIHECINSGGDWEDAREALKGFAHVIMRSCGVVIKP